MNFAVVVGSPLRSGCPSLRDNPTTTRYATNWQGTHLTEAKRCSEQADHLYDLGRVSPLRARPR